MTAHARIWFTTFATVGLLAGAVAAGLLWLLLAHPLSLLQAAAGWP